MPYRVELAPLAIADLIELRDWIVQRADWDTALRYLARIERKLATLATFPARGSRREDLGLGVRTLPFERRLLIVYRVGAEVVRIDRIVSGRRDPSGW